MKAEKRIPKRTKELMKIVVTSKGQLEAGIRQGSITQEMYIGFLNDIQTKDKILAAYFKQIGDTIKLRICQTRFKIINNELKS